MLNKEYNKRNLYINSQSLHWNEITTELKHGKKETHWMWFTFPQIIGISDSENSVKFAISNLNEAKEYLNDDILNDKLTTLINIILEQDNNDLESLFGYPDNLKFISSITLFEKADPSNDLFKIVFEKFSAERDNITLNILDGYSETKNKNTFIYYLNKILSGVYSKK